MLLSKGFYLVTDKGNVRSKQTVNREGETIHTPLRSRTIQAARDMATLTNDAFILVCNADEGAEWK